jgi:hypothetical protein
MNCNNYDFEIPACAGMTDFYEFLTFYDFIKFSVSVILYFSGFRISASDRKCTGADGDQPAGRLSAHFHVRYGQVFTGPQQSSDGPQVFSPGGFQQAHLKFDRGNPGLVSHRRGEPPCIVDQRGDGPAVEILHGMFEPGIVGQQENRLIMLIVMQLHTECLLNRRTGKKA